MLLKRVLFAACMAGLSPATATAVHYEVFIDAETEDDLYDLLVTGQISERSFDALLLLHQTRVDLGRADREDLYLLPNLDYADVDRILAYRVEAGAIRGVGDLVAGGVLPEALAHSLRAFVVGKAPATPRDRADGFVRTQLRWTGQYDRLPPAAAVQARARTASNLDAGVVGTLTRNGLRRVRWDPARRGLSVQPESVRFEVPKAYVAWKSDRWEIVGGTYRVGFGQRLTFDVTDQVTPNGAFGDYELRRDDELSLRCRRSAGELPESPCPRHRVARVTPDFTWTNRLTGVAVGAKHIPVGRGWMQAYAWGSYQAHRVQQSEIALAKECDDPRQDDDPDCSAPPVYVRGHDPSAPASAASFASLPAVMAEGLGGANASYFWNARVHVGMTGYGAVPTWLVRGVELGFQESARRPFGGPFGALGVNAALGFRRQDFFVEAARSFDRQAGGGGGYGAIARTLTTLDAGELEASLRYYAPNYANPYARPVSAPDQLDGLRARDEAGVRFRASVQPKRRIGIRAITDGWLRPSTGRLDLLIFLRADFELVRSWKWAWWVEYRHTRRRFSSTARLAYDPTKTIGLSWQLRHRWLGDSTARGAQHDLAAVFNFTARPVDLVRLRVRLRYDFEDIFDNHRLPQTVWTYAEATLTIRRRDALSLRYDLRAFLDERESTRIRAPNPEHWLWLEYVFRY